MDAVRCCSLGQITNALFEVGGQYRRNMWNLAGQTKACALWACSVLNKLKPWTLLTWTSLWFGLIESTTKVDSVQRDAQLIDHTSQYWRVPKIWSKAFNFEGKRKNRVPNFTSFVLPLLSGSTEFDLIHQKGRRQAQLGSMKWLFGHVGSPSGINLSEGGRPYFVKTCIPLCACRRSLRRFFINTVILVFTRRRSIISLHLNGPYNGRMVG